jgi:acetylornithine deacetylase/succinyl-diaminopimelate desuccinylase-like protein
MKDYLSQLTEFVSFKSVSTDKAYLPEIKKTVAWIQKLLLSGGFEVETLKGKNTNPTILANYQINKNAKTVLVYGHYDVQPAQKSDGWKSEPFSLTRLRGRLFGRGVVDNKGQILIHLNSVLALIESKNLKYNVMFLIEGNEETGNPDLAGQLRKYKNRLKADYILVSDGEMVGNNPAIDATFRGFANASIYYKTANNRLHSGLFGHAIPNAAIELGTLVSKFYRNNKIAIPGFYAEAGKVSKGQKKNNKIVLDHSPSILDSTGAKKLLTEKGLDFYSQIGLRPSLEVTGFSSGYTGEGFANIIPNEAEVKINIRTAPKQDAQKVYEAFKKFVFNNTPSYVSATVIPDLMNDGVELSLESTMTKKVIKMLEQVYNKKLLYSHVGGAIPIITDFKQILKKDTISVGLCNSDCNMHGANENFKINLIEKGLEFSKQFFSL